MSCRVNLALRHNMSSAYFHFSHHNSDNFIVNEHCLSLADLAKPADVIDKWHGFLNN